jgi:uncharacterized cupredoxin-like copper-binding protein
MLTRRTIVLAGSMLALPSARVRANASPATPQAGDTAIHVPVQVTEWEIDPGQRVFRTSQPYRFIVANQGAQTHEWVIERAGSNDEPLEREVATGDAPSESELEDIEPETDKTLTWTFADPGDYTMTCHIPGHAEAGMRTPFTVVDGASVKVVAVDASEYALRLAVDTVPAGTPVAFVVTNHGKLTHEFVLEPKGASDDPLENGGATSEIEDILPGARREIIWTFAQPGAIQVVCHIAGHMEAGMIASLTVTA